MKYRVMYKSTEYVYIDVEADSIEEAKEIAENTDGGEFIEDGVGDWEYDSVMDENGNILDQPIEFTFNGLLFGHKQQYN